MLIRVSLGLSLIISVNEVLADHPLVIAHRGASGHLPEHSNEAYERAILDGADFIEPDLVITKDGVLIARHENELSLSTNIQEVYPERKRVKQIEGERREGWFAEDFTYDEISGLRVRQTLKFREQKFNGLYRIARLDQILKLAKDKRVGVYIEIKHSNYFRSIGLPIEERLLQVLKDFGFDKDPDRVFIQSFEVNNLFWLKQNSPYRLIQLIGDLSERPADRLHTPYKKMLSEHGLFEITRYAYGIGAYKHLLVQKSLWGELEALLQLKLPLKTLREQPSRLVERAKEYGLRVHAWTFRSDPERLPRDYQNDFKAEYAAYQALGVDGFFTDFPGHAREYLKSLKTSD